MLGDSERAGAPAWIKKYTFAACILLLVAAIMGLASSETVLNALSGNLVRDDTLEPMEAIVVLSGSNAGNRLKEGVRLFKQGLGEPLVFVGYIVYPGTYWNALMKKYAVRLGVPEGKILSRRVDDEERSTWGEGRAVLKLLNSHNIKSFILVTSAFHTRRSYLIYKKLIDELGYPMKFLVHPARDAIYPVRGWWKTRSGQKMIFYEYTKLIYLFIEH